MEREPRRNVPHILARLRHDAEHRSDKPTAPRWARPVGWLIAATIIAVVVVVIIRANPL